MMTFCHQTRKRYISCLENRCYMIGWKHKTFYIYEQYRISFENIVVHYKMVDTNMKFAIQIFVFDGYAKKTKVSGYFKRKITFCNLEVKNCLALCNK